MIGFSERAIEALARSAAAARRFNPDARLRIAPDAAGVALSITDGPEPGDDTVERDGFTLYLASGLDGTLDIAEPHDTFVIRD
ncbi:MAG: hypothetical protein WD206_02825 [Actinomycetota bacterium]